MSCPTCATMIKAKKNARIKLNTGPAAMTDILARTDLLWNDFGSASSPASSPIMTQDPPNGKTFNEYLVSPFTVLISLGPIPTENSVTPIPARFASKKCPNSWTNTISPNNSIAARVFSNLPPAFYKFISFTLSSQNLLNVRMQDHLVVFHCTLDHINDRQIGNFSV